MNDDQGRGANELRVRVVPRNRCSRREWSDGGWISWNPEIPPASGSGLGGAGDGFSGERPNLSLSLPRPKDYECRMSGHIRSTVIMGHGDLGKVLRLKSDFMSQGYDLSIDQIMRLGIRELQTGGVSTATLKSLLSEAGGGTGNQARRV